MRHSALFQTAQLILSRSRRRLYGGAARAHGRVDHHAQPIMKADEVLIVQEQSV
jgi:hypothetical protein